MALVARSPCCDVTIQGWSNLQNQLLHLHLYIYLFILYLRVQCTFLKNESITDFDKTLLHMNEEQEKRREKKRRLLSKLRNQGCEYIS